MKMPSSTGCAATKFIYFRLEANNYVFLYSFAVKESGKRNFSTLPNTFSVQRADLYLFIFWVHSSYDTKTAVIQQAPVDIIFYVRKTSSQ